MATQQGRRIARREITLPEVKGWTGSDDMMADANRIQEAFLAGRLDPEGARLMVANMRNAIALVAIKLEHAKASKRIEIASDRLPSFTFKLVGDAAKEKGR